MCSFCQSVTLNLSGKKNLRGEPPSAPGTLGVGRKKENGETKEKEAEENHNGVAFQGHEWHQ